MNKALSSHLSLLLTIALVAELVLPAVRAAQGQNPKPPPMTDFSLDLTRVPAGTSPPAASTQPRAAQTSTTKASAKKPPAPVEQHMANSTEKYRAKVEKKVATSELQKAGPRFLYASFTQNPSTVAPKESPAGIPVKFSLSSTTLGTLSAPGSTVNPDGSIVILTNDEGVAEVTFTASSNRASGKLLATAGTAQAAVTLEVVRPVPFKWLLTTAAVIAAITGVVIVTTANKDKIKPLPPPVIP